MEVRFKKELGDAKSSRSDCHISNTKERPRVVLTRQQARDIFQLKTARGLASLHCASLKLASKYGVSGKAIRDIWKGRSWLDATSDLWNDGERPSRKMTGRPKGKKDSKPRKRGRGNSVDGLELLSDVSKSHITAEMACLPSIGYCTQTRQCALLYQNPELPFTFNARHGPYPPPRQMSFGPGWTQSSLSDHPSRHALDFRPTMQPGDPFPPFHAWAHPMTPITPLLLYNFGSAAVQEALHLQHRLAVTLPALKPLAF